ncbi:hypothetical protein B0T25DRAFT_634276 [Lasiosphaeria hispida]|uniref:Uncharacterized protein n=1 Tax=Lasiosphaeria hispida TaxID=260671 RepID=A0AAJ0MBJ8_9PEZI|nr:hypothetical protein B0T25DRAFT_634276 [Lasiosphaeria hispida]
MPCNETCQCHRYKPAPTPSSPPPPPPAVEYKAMQAVSAILNPETVAAVNGATAEKIEEDRLEKKVVLFQSLAANGTLGYDQVTFQPHDKLKKQGKGGVVGYYGNLKPIPSLKFGSTLASIVQDNFIHTYGVLENDGALWLLSPIYMPVTGAVTIWGIIAGCNDSSGNGYIFWQDLAKRKGIAMRDVSKVDGKTSTIGGTGDSLDQTSIAACNDSEYRYLAFQTVSQELEDDVVVSEKRTVRVVRFNGSEVDIDDIPGSDEIVRGQHTKIAMVHAVDASKGINRIYVYFTNVDGRLSRSYTDIVSGQKISFKTAVTTENSITVAKHANLSVVAAKGKNIIYTVKSVDSEISYSDDKWTYSK